VLLAIPVLVAMVTVIYRGYLQALEERDTWERLQSVSRELLGAGPAALADAADRLNDQLRELTA